jgi:hypothetical protein
VGLLSTILGVALGGGALLIFVGMRKLTNRELDDAARRKGFWPLNAGLVLAAVSMYLMLQARGG